MRGWLGARAMGSAQVSDWGAAAITVPSRRLGHEIPLDTSGMQGVFYWIGTDYGAAGFANPTTDITLTSSTTQAASRYNATARDTTDWSSASQSGNWFKIDLGSSRRLIPDYMSFRQRSSSASSLLQSFIMEGSTDDATWSTLATVSDGAMNESPGAWTHIPLSPIGAFRFLRLTMTGTDSTGWLYLVIGEIEFYGTFFATP